MTSRKNNIELIIRPKAQIKSRQWWDKYFKRFRKILFKYLPNKTLHLSKNSSVTLLITNDEEIRKLNKRYRNINKPTDVLSFPFYKKKPYDNKYLGDIVISAQAVKKQAFKQNIRLETELLKLFIHGYLHLLGYNHKAANEAKIMFSLQNKLLKSISSKRM